MSRIHYRTCTLCEATCGVAVETDGDRVVSIRGDERDVFSKGYICPKAAALADLYDDPDRLRVPHRRTASGWEPMAWDDAFDEVAGRLRAIQRTHGKDAVAVYQGNPTAHSLGLMTFGQVFLRNLGTRNAFSATSADQLPHMLSSLTMLGNWLLLPVPDLDRTRLFVIFGANPVVSNGSAMTAPNMRGRLKALRARNARIVVVDPRRTETAALADQHIPIRPGTDAALLLAMLHVIFTEGRDRPGRLGPHLANLDEVREVAARFAPERVATATGVAATTIRELAREIATTRPAVCYGRVGICTQEFGGLASWLVNVVNIVTGNFDEPGGFMFAHPAVDVARLAARFGATGSFDRYRSRVRGLPEFGGELPVSTFAEEIETPGEGQIRAVVTSAGNPVLSIPNGARLDRALATLELMVSIDPYINETTRHADIILPPTTPLERSHYDLGFYAVSVRNVAKYAPPLIERGPDQRHDWEIALELATRLGLPEGRLGATAGRLLRAAGRRMGPEAILDAGLRAGPYRLSLKKLRAHPHGIDLGPLRPRLPDALATRDGRIDMAPAIYTADVGRLEARLDAGAPEQVSRGRGSFSAREGVSFAAKARGATWVGPKDRRATPAAGETDREAGRDSGPGTLALIGRRQLRSNNSWMHNSYRLVKGKPRCTLLIHPDDAAARGLADGDTARIASRVGAIEIPIEISDEMMPGVVSIPHGWGHDRDGVAMSVAAEHPGASLNDITDEAFLDELSGNSGFSGVAVEVTKAASASATDAA